MSVSSRTTRQYRQAAPRVRLVTCGVNISSSNNVSWACTGSG
jgi:hypothetical protein